jgi:nitrogen fixation/metabolism regulation signal transduction histidine kinase
VQAASIEVATFKKANQVYLTVTDNGAGFPVEILSRAFEPYMTTKRHGTGLGLAIVKKIVEEHQGSIAIENIKVDDLHKTGAVVIVALPVHLVASEKSSVKRKKAEQV